MNDKILEQLIEIIVGVTGNNPEIITAKTNLEDDLGIVLEDDFTRLIFNINQRFNIELEAEEISEIVSTVSDLANIINEELELG